MTKPCQENYPANRKRRLEHSSKKTMCIKDRYTTGETKIKRQKVIKDLADKRARVSLSLKDGYVFELRTY